MQQTSWKFSVEELLEVPNLPMEVIVLSRIVQNLTVNEKSEETMRRELTKLLVIETMREELKKPGQLERKKIYNLKNLPVHVQEDFL